LSSVLLAMPQVLGGKTSLEGGSWPERSRFAAWQQLLQGFGVSLSSLENGLVSQPGSPETDLRIDCRKRKECFPIGLALCLCKPGGGLVLGERGEDFEFALELLHKLELPFEEQSDSIRVLKKPEGQPAKISLTAPHSLWGLALALVSLVRPSIVLRNPGELTGLWPQFWNIFKGLPEPQKRMQEKEAQKKDSDEPKRRRIRV
jgi:3-phosphoshikimate 1-carboxyvinyltransferase